MNPIKLDAIKTDQTFKGELLLDKSYPYNLSGL